MLPSALIVSAQSAKIVLLEPFFEWPHSTPRLLLLICDNVSTESVSPGVNFLCATRKHGHSPNVVLHCCSAKGSDSRSTVFLNLVPRVNARYALRCWHQNRIKGSCANTLFLAPFGNSCCNGALLPQTVHYLNQATLCLQHPFPLSPVITQVLIPKRSSTQSQLLVKPLSRSTTRMMITTLRTIGRRFGWPPSIIYYSPWRLCFVPAR
jgi:hypothetical protein